MSSIRIDAEMVIRGLANSRERAKEYIQKGYVYVNDTVIKKPSALVSETDEIKVIGDMLKYVGRGGLKMESAVKEFSLTLDDMICVDIGASTGGFTDCMLQNGAKKVYAIDVGHNQLAQKLLEDKRVVNIEGMNVKDITSDTVSDHIDLVCADLSFISCRYAIDASKILLSDDGVAVILIKPQFEAGKSNISKGGIVKDKKAHLGVLNDICSYAISCGFSINKLISSPIKGGDGNIEYLVMLVKDNGFTHSYIDYKAIVDSAFAKK